MAPNPYLYLAISPVTVTDLTISYGSTVATLSDCEISSSWIYYTDSGYGDPGDIVSVTVSSTGYKTVTQNCTIGSTAYITLEKDTPTTLDEKMIAIYNEAQKIKASIINKGQTVTDNMTEYATAINSISTVNNQTKTTTVNGDVTPDSGYTGLSKVTVNVPSVSDDSVAKLNAMLGIS